MGQDTILGTDAVKDALLTKLDNDLAELFASVAAIAAGSGIIISLDDTTPGVLDGKILVGDGIDFTVGSPGGNETLTISFGDVKDKEIEFDNYLDAIIG